MLRTIMYLKYILQSQYIAHHAKHYNIYNLSCSHNIANRAQHAKHYNYIYNAVIIIGDLLTMLSEGARVALPFIVVGSPGQVSSEDFARGALSKPTAMVDTHVRAILSTRFRVHNARVHDFSPHAIEVALGQTFHFGLLHIGPVQREEFCNAVVLHVPAYFVCNILVMYSNNCVTKKSTYKSGELGLRCECFKIYSSRNATAN